MKGEPVTILLVEDDPAHAEIVKRSFEDFNMAYRLIQVSDGQEALDYLYCRADFSDPDRAPRPVRILLDLHLPRIYGLDVLKTIKSDNNLCRIPVLILTTSAAESDIVKAYDSHANSYMVKPVDHLQFVDMMKMLGFLLVCLEKISLLSHSRRFQWIRQGPQADHDRG